MKILRILLFVFMFLHVSLNYAQTPAQKHAARIYAIADSLYAASESRVALDTLLNVLPAFNRIENDTLESKVLSLFGHLHKKIGNDTVSIKNYITGLSNQQIQQYINAVEAMGYYFHHREQHSKALGYYRKMMLFAQTVNDSAALAKAQFYTGRVFKAMLNYSKSIAYLHKALAYYESKDSLRYRVAIYNELGEIALTQNQGDSAVAYFRKTIALARNIHSPESRIIAFNRLASIMKNKGNYGEAVHYIKKGIAIARQNQSARLPELLLHHARLFQMAGQTELALKQYQKCLQAARRHENLKIQTEAALKLGDFYSKKGNYENASRFYKISIENADSLRGINSMKEMARFEAQYNLLQKEQEIALIDRERKLKDAKLQNEQLRSQIYLWGLIILVLMVVILSYLIATHIRKNRLLSAQNSKINEQNEELNQMNEQLSESEHKLMRALATKNKLFAIIGHDLKSPLMDIKNLIFILKLKPGQFSADDLNKHASQIENRLSLLLELLNNLLNWGMTERKMLNYTPAETDINKLLNNVLNLFEGQIENKQINVQKNVPDKLLWTTDSNMLEFILRNIISNAIKFSSTAQSIFIHAKVNANHLLIAVEDQGTGMSQEQINHIFELSSEKVRRGTQNEKGTGLGMAVTYSFIQQMGADVNITSKPGEGTRIELSLPEKKTTNQ